MTIYNFLGCIKSYLPIFISALALFIAWKSYQKTQLPLDSYCSPDSTPIKILLLDNEEKSSLYIPNLQMVTLTVINPSDTDLDFFSLRLIDDNNQELHIVNNETVKIQSGGYVCHKALDGYGNLIQINLLDSFQLNGTFKAHSITNISIPFSLDSDTKKCLLVYKVARHKKLFCFNKPAYGYTESKYESHSHEFEIVNSDLSEIPPELTKE